MGVLPLPEGYDVHGQIVRNSITRQLGFYRGRLTLAAIVLVGLTLVLLRRRRSRRTAR